MELLIVLLVATVLLAAILALENHLHRQRLRAIPIRVHVNGTRGKSSVTRLIAAGLRAGGIRALAKTTGTLPRLVEGNGIERPIPRPFGANIIEQRDVVRFAVERKVQALVIECMALQPHLQWLAESRLVRSTHGVITNARPDHLDVMGPTEKDVAWALAGTVPVNGRLFTNEQQYLDVFAEAAKLRGSELCFPGRIQIEPPTAAEMAAFTYQEHAENVALALAVCTDLGVPRDLALAGMTRAAADPGAMTEHRISFYGRDILFINGFAANDPVSTRQIWHDALARHPGRIRRIAVFNCRSDRSDRSQQLGEAYAEWTQADIVALIGTGQWIFGRAALQRGVDPSRIVYTEYSRPADIFEALLAHVGPQTLIMGMGNTAGPGLALVDYFAHRSALPPEESPAWSS